MKLILTILNDKVSAEVTQALVDANYNVLQVDSSGGFFREGNSTLMIGVEEDLVHQAIEIIDQNCPQSVDPLVSRGTILVLNLDHFEEI